MASKRVVVIGGAAIDIRARSGDAIVAGTSNIGEIATTPGGVGRNIAVHLARLGVATSLLTALGLDAHGDAVRAATVAAGVDMALAIRAEAATATYCAMLDHDGELVVAVNSMAILDLVTVAHVERCSGALDRADMIVADCNIPAETIAYVAARCGGSGKRLVIEPVSVPKSAKLALLPMAVYAVTPNRAEAVAMAGGDRDVGAAIIVLHRRGFGNVVVKLGADGAVASADGGARRAAIPAIAPTRAIRDVTGAGDAAVAGLVYALLSGADFLEAARVGQVAAGLVLGGADVSSLKFPAKALVP